MPVSVACLRNAHEDYASTIDRKIRQGEIYVGTQPEFADSKQVTLKLNTAKGERNLIQREQHNSKADRAGKQACVQLLFWKEGVTEKRHSGLDSHVNPTPAPLLQRQSLARSYAQPEASRQKQLHTNSPSYPPPKVYLLHLKQESWNETL